MFVALFLRVGTRVDRLFELAPRAVEVRVELVCPDFLVIGAQKAATTWLWTHLRDHPELRGTSSRATRAALATIPAMRPPEVPSPLRCRSRVLALVDMPGWAHDHKTDNLIRCLGDRFEIRKCYQSEVQPHDIAAADVVVLYYWRQLDVMSPELRDLLERSRGKLVLGICSHNELDGELRAPGLAWLRRLPGNGT